MLSSSQQDTQGPALNNKGTSELHYKAETTVTIAVFADSLVAVVLAGKEVGIKLVLETVAERWNLVSAVVSCMTLGGRLKLSELQFSHL